MLSRLGLKISAVFERTAPDPFVIAILLTALTAILALTIGFDGTEFADRPEALLNAWRTEGGLWKFLAFGMQMCLILVTGHAVAVSRPVRWLITRLAALPRSTASAAALVALVACLASVINWGLCLIVGALLARDVGRAMAKRGIRVHYPLIAAAGYTGMMLWHGGFSGSAPLSMTSLEGAAKVLPESELARLGGDAGIPLTETVLSPMNLVVTGGLIIIIPILVAMLAPKDEAQLTPIPEAMLEDEADKGDDAADAPAGRNRVVAFLERSPALGWLLALALVVALAQYAAKTKGGLTNPGLNEVNAAMLALGLVLHGSPIRYARAIEDGARGCAGIILQFPLYAGIMGMMSAAGLVALLAEGIASGGGQSTPLLTFASAGIVNLFVPSGGGQWGIQGPIALSAGAEAGISPGSMVMAVAYGDQLTNMLQPFWALPLLAITGVKARQVVGYTCIVMLVGAVWMGGCLLLMA